MKIHGKHAAFRSRDGSIWPILALAGAVVSFATGWVLGGKGAEERVVRHGEKIEFSQYVSRASILWRILEDQRQGNSAEAVHALERMIDVALLNAAKMPRHARCHTMYMPANWGALRADRELHSRGRLGSDDDAGINELIDWLLAGSSADSPE